MLRVIRFWNIVHKQYALQFWNLFDTSHSSNSKVILPLHSIFSKHHCWAGTLFYYKPQIRKWFINLFANGFVVVVAYMQLAHSLICQMDCANAINVFIYLQKFALVAISFVVLHNYIELLGNFSLILVNNWVAEL